MKDEPIQAKFRRAWPQIFAVLVCTTTAISDGMQGGWSAPLLPILRQSDSPIPIDKSDEWWIEQIYIIGGLFGLPLTCFLVDRIGRKGTIVFAACTSLCGWILTIVSELTGRIEYLLVCRFLTGLAADVGFVSSPMYVAEIADKKIRGLLASVINVMLLLGIIIIYVVGTLVPIYVSSLIGCAILILQLCAFLKIPESPYYLLGKGKKNQAKHSLKKLRADPNVEKELMELTAAVQRQNTEKGRPQDLILVKSNRKAVIIMTVLNASQHLSGISVFTMNLHSILEAGKSTYMQSLETGITFAVIMLLACFMTTFMIDKFGRKILLVTSSILSGLSILALAVYFTLQKSGQDVSNLSWIPIVAVMIYAWAFKYGVGTVPLVMTSELFSSKMKSMGMTLSDFMYLIWAFIAIEIYHALGDRYGLDIPFYVFAASSLVTTTFCLLYIPETKGKTLEEIQFILKGEPLPVPSCSNESGTTDKTNHI